MVMQKYRWLRKLSSQARQRTMTRRPMRVMAVTSRVMVTGGFMSAPRMGNVLLEKANGRKKEEKL